MNLNSYDQLNSLEIDTLKEIGSIGTGNAATSLSQILGKAASPCRKCVSWSIMKPSSGSAVRRP